MDKHIAIAIASARYPEAAVGVEVVEPGEEFRFQLRFAETAEPEYETATREQLLVAASLMASENSRCREIVAEFNC